MTARPRNRRDVLRAAFDEAPVYAPVLVLIASLVYRTFGQTGLAQLLMWMGLALLLFISFWDEESAWLSLLPTGGMFLVMVTAATLPAGLAPPPLAVALASPERVEAVCTGTASGFRGWPIARYEGTVIARPAADGRVGATRPSDYLPSEAVFIQAGGEDLILYLRPTTDVEPGAQLAFCGVPGKQVAFWPQTGYRGGLAGRNAYGSPVGEYREVRWLIDMPDWNKEDEVNAAALHGH